jgi:hypothetical protein
MLVNGVRRAAGESGSRGLVEFGEVTWLCRSLAPRPNGLKKLLE